MPVILVDREQPRDRESPGGEDDRRVDRPIDEPLHLHALSAVPDAAAGTEP